MKLRFFNGKQLKRFFRLSVPGNPLLSCPRAAEASAEAQATRKRCRRRKSSFSLNTKGLIFKSVFQLRLIN